MNAVSALSTLIVTSLAAGAGCEGDSSRTLGDRIDREAVEIAGTLDGGDLRRAFVECSAWPVRLSATSDAWQAACGRVFEAARAATGDLAVGLVSMCRTMREVDRLGPDGAETCDALAATTSARLLRDVAELRDRGRADEETCRQLEEVIHAGHGDARVIADACQEMRLAADVAATRAEVRADVAARELTSPRPSHCYTLVEELGALGTPWAARTRDELLEACYVERAIAIIPALATEATSESCPYELRHHTEIARMFHLARRSPALAAVIAPLPASCSE